MVSVALAMASPLRPNAGCGRVAAALPKPSAATCPLSVLRAFYAASDVPVLQAVCPGAGFDIAWHQKSRKESHDVHDVSGLSEPHGPDGAMADRGRIGAEIPQPRPAGRLRQAVRPARGSPRTGFADLAALRHRQGAGGKSGAGGDRGNRVRDAVRLALAFQEGEFAGAAAHAAGGAD